MDVLKYSLQLGYRIFFYRVGKLKFIFRVHAPIINCIDIFK